jgi:hypothetical protein
LDCTLSNLREPVFLFNSESPAKTFAVGTVQPGMRRLTSFSLLLAETVETFYNGAEAAGTTIKETPVGDASKF